MKAGTGNGKLPAPPKPSLTVICFPQPQDHAGSGTKIVLMIVYSVVETRHLVVGFNRWQRNVPGELDFEPGARGHDECVR